MTSSIVPVGCVSTWIVLPALLAAVLAGGCAGILTLALAVAAGRSDVDSDAAGAVTRQGFAADQPPPPT
jgi:hypothetical protein